MPEDVDVNVAHTDGVLVLALARRRVGVDVEELPPTGEDLIGLAEVVATPAELDELRYLDERIRPAAFQRWWVRKEAVLKAEGTGFLTDPRAVHVGITVAAQPAPWVVHALGLVPGPGRPALAVAIEGDAGDDKSHPVVVFRPPTSTLQLP